MLKLFKDELVENVKVFYDQKDLKNYLKYQYIKKKLLFYLNSVLYSVFKAKHFKNT